MHPTPIDTDAADIDRFDDADLASFSDADLERALRAVSWNARDVAQFLRAGAGIA